MSSIRKYNGTTGWQKFAETNINDASDISAAGIYTTSHISSVQDVLDDLKTDVDQLKRNVSWLALHGGGGSGSGSGTSRKASCTLQITIGSNSYSDGSLIPITEGQPVIVTMSNIKPSASTWSVDFKLSYGGVTIAKTGTIKAGSSTYTVLWEDIETIMESNKFAQKSLEVTVTCTDANGTTVSGSKTINTTLYIPNVDMDIYIPATKYVISALQNDKVADEIVLTGNTTITGPLSINLSSDPGTDFLSGLIEFNQESDTINQSIALSSLFYNKKNIQKGTYKLIADLKQGGVTLLTIKSSDIMLLNNGINIFFDGLADGTEVLQSYKWLSFYITVIRSDSSSGSWRYSSYIKNHSDGDDSYKNIASTSLIYDFETKQPITDHLESSGFAFTDTDGQFDYKIVITDSSGASQTFIFTLKLATSTKKFVTIQRPYDAVKTTSINKIIDISQGMDNFPYQKFESTSLRISTSYSVDKPITMQIVNRNSTSGYKPFSDERDCGPYIRFDNKCYGIIEDTFINNLDNKGLNSLKRWTISLGFQTDGDSNDDHIVFGYGQCGEVGSKNQLINGICVKTHGIYVNNTKVIHLNNQTDYSVDFVYSCNNGDYDQWMIATDSRYTAQYTKNYLKIYVNGILEHIQTACPFGAATSFSGTCRNCTFYFGGIPSSDINNQTCDFRLYEFTIYDDALDDINVLGDYINTSILFTKGTSGKEWDYSGLTTIANRNLCFQQADGTLSSDVIKGGLLNLDNIFTASKVPPVTDTEVEKLSSTIESVQKIIDLDIVLIDACNAGNAWTFSDFTQNLKIAGTSIEDITNADIYYWNISKNNKAVKIQNATAGVQGTSTLGNYIKNIDITLHEDTNKKDIFCPVSSWIPESTYTLKADIVDSAHANNASIGKFINDTFSDSSTFAFGFNQSAKEIFAKSNTYVRKNAYIKHTVEGYPVLLYVNFKGSDGASIDQRFLGIYSFNLGRKAFRNYGIKSIGQIKDSNGNALTSFTYPGYYPDCQYDEDSSDDNGPCDMYWVETDESDRIPSTCVDVLSNDVTRTSDKDISESTFMTNSAAFWQSDTSIIKEKFQVRYSSNAQITEENPELVTALTGLIDQVIGIPIEGPYFSQYDAMSKSYDIYGSYNKLRKVGNEYKVIGTNIMEKVHPGVASDERDKAISNIDAEFARKYFVIAMLFGLRDNFDKNVSYRQWVSSDTTKDSKIRTEFYDLDTALGLTNKGYQNVSPLMWFKGLNNNNSVGLIEQYDNSESRTRSLIDQQGEETTALETDWNKLWLSLDSEWIRNGNSMSYYSKYWFDLRTALYDLAVANGEQSFVDYFMHQYFEKQIENCGEIILNHDYRMKYLNVFDSSSSGVRNPAYETTSAKEKADDTSSYAHGKRVEYVRDWLTKRINFLDALFLWRAQRNIDGMHLIKDDDVNNTITYDTTDQNSINVESKYDALIFTKDASGGTSVKAATKLVLKNISQEIQNPSALNGKIMQNSDIISKLDLSKSHVLQLQGSLKNLEQLIITSGSLDEKQFNLSFFDNKIFRKLTLTNVVQSTAAASFDFDTTGFDKVIDLNLNSTKLINGLNIKTIPFRTLNVNGTSIQKLEIKDQHYVLIPDIDQCSQLTSVTIENCDFENRDDATVKDFTIRNNNNLQELTVKGSPGISSVTIEKCNQLNHIILVNCPNITNIYISECSSLTANSNVSANSTFTTTRTETNHDSIEILGLSALSSLTMSELDNDVLGVHPGSFTISHDSVSGLVEFDINKSGFKYMTYAYDNESENKYDSVTLSCVHFTDVDFSDRPDNTYGVFDMSEMTKLSSINMKETKCIQYLKLKNIETDPFDFSLISGIGRASDGGFNNMIELRRIFGNVSFGTETRGMCWFSTGTKSKFSLFGHHIPATWRGMDVSEGKTIWEMISEKGATAINTFTELQISNGYVKITGATPAESFTEFDSSEFALNVLMDRFTGNTVGCFPTEGWWTWFDVYYLMYRIAVNNKSPRQGNMIYDLSEMFNINRADSDNGNFGNSDLLPSQLPRKLFLNLSDLSSINIEDFDSVSNSDYDGEFGCSTNLAKQFKHAYYANARPFIHMKCPASNASTVTIYSPTLSGETFNDDGTFSPLTNLLFMRSITDYSVTDKNLFRRSSGSYSLQHMSRIFGQAGGSNYSETSWHAYDTHYFVSSNLDNYFDNLQNLVMLNFSMQFANKSNSALSATSVNVSNLRFPTSLEHIHQSFTDIYGNSNKRTKYAGNLIMTNLFPAGSRLKVCSGVFNAAGDGSSLQCYVYPEMFDHTLSIQGYGAQSIGWQNAAFRGNNTAIALSSINDLDLENKPTFTTDAWNHFCKCLFHNNDTSATVKTKSIKYADFILYNTTFGNKYTVPSDYLFSFPNGLFTGLSTLQSTGHFMRLFDGYITLEGKGFEDCPSIYTVNNMFETTNGKGISSEIPYQFFYHGQTTQTDVFSGFNLIDLTETITLTSVSKFRSDFDGLNSSTDFDDISSTVAGAHLTSAKLANLGITDVSICDAVSMKGDIASRLPLNTTKDTTALKYKNAFAKLAEITDNDWRDKVLEVQSESQTYSKPNHNIIWYTSIFRGNKHIQPYTGNSKPEYNEYYQPFDYTYNSSTKSIVNTTDTKNTYRKSIIWSENGTLNTTQTDKYSLCNDIAVVDKHQTYEVRTGGTDSGGYSFVRYDQENTVLNYICAPDIFRYSWSSGTNSTSPTVAYAFYDTSKNSGERTIGNWLEPSYAEYNDALKGITGRIPPCLLWGFKYLYNSSYLFSGQRHIAAVKRNGYIEFIPNEFFKYISNLRNLEGMFRDMFIPYNSDFSAVFNNFKQSTNEINLRYIFADCWWEESSTEKYYIQNVFDGVKCSNIDYAFGDGFDYNYNGSMGYMIANSSFSPYFFGNVEFRENFNNATINTLYNKVNYETKACAVYYGQRTTDGNAARLAPGIKYYATWNNNSDYKLPDAAS